MCPYIKRELSLLRRRSTNQTWPLHRCLGAFYGRQKWRGIFVHLVYSRKFKLFKMSDIGIILFWQLLELLQFTTESTVTIYNLSSTAFLQPRTFCARVAFTFMQWCIELSTVPNRRYVFSNVLFSCFLFVPFIHHIELMLLCWRERRVGMLFFLLK